MYSSALRNIDRLCDGIHHRPVHLKPLSHITFVFLLAGPCFIPPTLRPGDCYTFGLLSSNAGHRVALSRLRRLLLERVHATRGFSVLYLACILILRQKGASFATDLPPSGKYEGWYNSYPSSSAVHCSCQPPWPGGSLASPGAPLLISKLPVRCERS